MPKRLQPLREIACNLWWTWTHEARELLVAVDPEAWKATRHNPIAMLGSVSQERLRELERDEDFLARLDRVKKALDAYMSKKTWYDQKVAKGRRTRIAYFSAEFGIHECLPIYSGGLGVLAGDHLKSASGLGLPLVGVGLFYHNGYCRQYLSADGWQQEFLHANDFYNLPCSLERDAEGRPITVSVELAPVHREVRLQIWRVQVGRVPLFLLDSRMDANHPDDRSITDQLYGGDHEHRLKQEIALGIGGFRALRALGLEPEVCHMNEGHSAFLAIERIRVLVEEKGLSFEQAREAVMAGSVFTTHTPVPAGIDRFGPDQIDRYFGSWYQRLGCDRKTFMALGRIRPHDEGEPFSMALLAIKTAGWSNGVSKLHGRVSREMWKDAWPDVPTHEIPIFSITNGVHIRSYMSDALDALFQRYAGARWAYDACDAMEGWTAPDRIPDAELWRVHEKCRASLVAWVRERLKIQLVRRGAGHDEIAAAEEALDPEALTIGFARRFAAYKRATLLFKDLDRLAAIIGNRDRPVQIICAGKAHPRDSEGKKLIQEIIRATRDPRFRRSVVFLEDYDLGVARMLVQGCDVWLNTPRRPLEASGTSGMKAAANGVLNCSILDGWWCEAYDGTNGWAIGTGEEYSDYSYQDQVESRAIYELLEKHIVPMFYDRGADGMPREWIKRMKKAMKTCIPMFSALRMVREYAEKAYLPAGDRWKALAADNFLVAREMWDWKMNLFMRWAQIRFISIEISGGKEMPVGSSVGVSAQVHLGPIDPSWVEIQMYAGALNTQGQIEEGVAYPMALDRQWKGPEGVFMYRGIIPCSESGRFGVSLRAVPKHRNLPNPFIPGLITWEQG